MPLSDALSVTNLAGSPGIILSVHWRPIGYFGSPDVTESAGQDDEHPNKHDGLTTQSHSSAGHQAVNDPTTRTNSLWIVIVIAVVVLLVLIALVVLFIAKRKKIEDSAELSFEIEMSPENDDCELEEITTHEFDDPISGGVCEGVSEPELFANFTGEGLGLYATYD
jgi:hypothetical protein